MSLRRRLVGSLLMALALGIISAVLLGALRVEPSRLFTPQRSTVAFTGVDGHRWAVDFWPGPRYARDALNVSFTGSGPPSVQDLDHPAIRDLPHAPWRSMIRRASAQCTTGGAFFNLQAWGFPFRSMTGGFAKGPPRQLSWYLEFKIGARDISLATRPIWPGLIGNALVFTLILLPVTLTLSTAVRSVRSWRRRGKGLCPHCRYDLRATPPNAPCPECGRTSANRPTDPPAR